MSTSTCSPYITDLISHCSTHKLEFKPSPIGGTGAYTLTPLTAGDVLFSLPRSLILSSHAPTVLKHPLIHSLCSNKDITAETLLFTYMILTKTEGSNGYLNSLTPYSPLDASELSGTNVGAQLVSDVEEVRNQLQHVHKVLPDLTEEDFLWAKQHYNGRRYPLKFSLSVADDTATHTSDKDTVYDDGKKRKREECETGSDNQSETKSDGDSTTPSDLSSNTALSEVSQERRLYDATQGSLVPLLDVLNHTSEHEHPLIFEVDDDNLVVKTAIDYAAGDEVFSNYGCTNNDSFLLQFGFCDMSNESMDLVAVKAVGGGVHELRPGKIPESLLQDGGESLYYFLKSKKKSLQFSKTDPSDNVFVAHYMERQRKLLKLLIKELDAMSY